MESLSFSTPETAVEQVRRAARVSMVRLAIVVAITRVQIWVVVDGQAPSLVAVWKST